MKIYYVLDTHSFIWELQNPDKLGKKARQVIESAADGEIVLSSHSIVELGRLIEKRAPFPVVPANCFSPRFVVSR